MKYSLIVALVALLGVVTAHRLPTNERVERDLRDNLLQRADDLEKKCQTAIEQLTQENRTHEVEHLEKEQVELKKLATELKAATEHADITHLEHQLIDVERRVVAELKRIHLNPINERRDRLVKRADVLVKHANEAIKHLESQNKTTEAEQIKKDEETMQQLVVQLKAATTTKELIDLEHKVIEIETKLAQELRKIHTRVARDIRDLLLKRAEDLLKRSTEAITQLTNENRTHDAERIKKEDDVLKKLVTQLKDPKTTADKLKQIELEVGAVEIVLEIELSRIHNRPARDLKEDLLHRADDLEKKCQTAIEQLTHENRTHEVEHLEKEQAELKKLAAELKAATAKTDITHLEHQLMNLERRVVAELRHIHFNPINERRDRLIKHADVLVKQANDAIKHLESQNKTTEAEQIKKDEETLQKLVVELKAATTTKDLVDLEHKVTEIETKLAHELRHHHVRGTRDIRDLLLKRAEDLLKRSTEAITQLTNENRTHDAERIKKEDDVLKKLVTQLKDPKTTADKLKQLELEVGAVEIVLEIELSRILTRPARDLKDDLLHRADDLEKKCQTAIEQLTHENRTHEVEHLEKEQAELKKLAAELKAATAKTDITHLEHQLMNLERRVVAELRHIHFNPINERRDRLIKHADVLVKHANDAIKLLESHNKTTEAEQIKKDEETLQKLVVELKAATATKELIDLEHKVTEIETKLAHELRKIHTREARDIRDLLLKRAEDLLKRSTEAITQLTNENRTQDAERIKKEDDVLKKLVTQLKDPKTTADKLKQLELEVGAVEIVLEIELSRILTRPARDLKDDLLKRAEVLLKEAQEAVDKLTKENRKHEAEHIEKDQAQLKKLAETLKNAPAGTNVSHIEHEISTLENRLKIEIRKALTDPTKELKERLIKHAELLEKHANEAIKHLESQNKTTEAEQIKKDEEALQKLVVELKAATTHDQLVKLEHEVIAAEKRLTEELRKAHVHFRLARDTVDDLLKRAETLLKRSHEAIEALTELNRKHEAEHIEREQAELEKLIAHLKTVNKHENIRHLVHEIDNLEHRLQQELDRLHIKPTHDHREELLKRAHHLIKEADEAIKILENNNQTDKAETFKADQQNLKKLAEQLKDADKHKLVELEKEVAAAEAKLSHELGNLFEQVKKVVILRASEKLEADVDAEIKKLDAAGHHAYTQGLAQHKQQLEQFVSELRNATDVHVIEHLEKEIIHLGTFLFHELQLIERDIAFMKHLIERSEAILRRADVLIPELKSKNLTDAADILGAERAELVLFTEQVKNETSIFALTYLETKLNHLETSIAKKIIELEKKLLESTSELRKPRDIRDNLLKRAEDLLKRSEEAIQKLTKDNRKHEAEHIEREDAVLKKLAAELKDTNLTGARLVHLEHEISSVETRLNAELNRLHLRQTRDVRENLLKRAEDLLKRSEEAIQKLTKDNRKHEAEHIEREDAVLKKLAAELKDTNLTGARLVHLEHEISSVETRLNAELNRLHLRQTRDVRDNLLKRAEDLLKKSEEAIQKLTKDNRKHEAEHIEREDAVLKKLAAELKDTNLTGARLVHLEHEIASVETRLNAELNRLHLRPTRDIRNTLLKRAEDLLKKSQDAIQKLNHENRQKEAEHIERENAALKKLVEQLKDSTLIGDKLKQVEREVAAVEARLDLELHHVHLRQARDIRDDLLKRAETLLKRSHEAIDALTELNRKHEAEHIEREQAELEKLIAHLKTVNHHENIRHLVHEIDNLEHRLQKELDRLHLKPTHDHREELLKRAHHLIKEAEEAIKILESNNQTAEVETVKVDEENLKKLAEQLKDADKHKLVELEKEVAAAEAKLGHELGKIHDQVKKAVILKASEKLEADVDAEIKKLDAAGHQTYTRGLAQHKQQLEQFVSELRSATDAHVIEHLEKEIIHLGEFLYQELQLIERDIAFMKVLIERSDSIIKRVDSLIPELYSKNLTDAADILGAERQELVLFTVQVKNEASIFALTYLETKLDHLEKSLTEKIIELEKKLMEKVPQVGSFNSQELIERAAKLMSKVREAIEKLKSEGKPKLANVLEKVEKTLLYIDEKVQKNLHPTTESGKKELELLEELLKKAEDTVEAELKKLNLH